MGVDGGVNWKVLVIVAVAGVVLPDTCAGSIVAETGNGNSVGYRVDIAAEKFPAPLYVWVTIGAASPNLNETVYGAVGVPVTVQFNSTVLNWVEYGHGPTTKVDEQGLKLVIAIWHAASVAAAALKRMAIRVSSLSIRLI
jgi:hypothetical protein